MVRRGGWYAEAGRLHPSSAECASPLIIRGYFHALRVCVESTHASPHSNAQMVQVPHSCRLDGIVPLMSTPASFQDEAPLQQPPHPQHLSASSNAVGGGMGGGPRDSPCLRTSFSVWDNGPPSSTGLETSDSSSNFARSSAIATYFTGRTASGHAAASVNPAASGGEAVARRTSAGAPAAAAEAATASTVGGAIMGRLQPTLSLPSGGRAAGVKRHQTFSVATGVPRRVASTR